MGVTIWRTVIVVYVVEELSFPLLVRTRDDELIVERRLCALNDREGRRESNALSIIRGIINDQTHRHSREPLALLVRTMYSSPSGSWATSSPFRLCSARPAPPPNTFETVRRCYDSYSRRWHAQTDSSS